MKQNITWEQLAECKKPGTLLRWMEKKGYNGYRMPPQGEVEPLLPNIGQLIELLSESEYPEGLDAWEFFNQCGSYYPAKNLCDSLWETVKQVLEGEKV